MKLLFPWQWQITHLLFDQCWEPKIRKYPSFRHAGLSPLDGLPLSNLLGAEILVVTHVYWSTAYGTRVACIGDLDQWGERQHMLVWRAKPSGMSCVLDGNSYWHFKRGYCLHIWGQEVVCLTKDVTLRNFEGLIIILQLALHNTSVALSHQ